MPPAWCFGAIVHLQSWLYIDVRFPWFFYLEIISSCWFPILLSMHTKRLTGFRNSFLSPNLDIHSSFSFLDLCNFRHFLKGEDGGERECCINPNRLVSITVKFLAQDHGENATLPKTPESRNIYGWYSMIGRRSNSWGTADSRAQTWCRWRFMARKPSHGWSVSPTLRQNHMIFFRPKHANVPLNHDCHDYQHPLKSFLCREKKNLQAKIAAWRSGDVGWATLSCRADDPNRVNPVTMSLLGEFAGWGLSSWSSYWICDGGAVGDVMIRIDPSCF